MLYKWYYDGLHPAFHCAHKRSALWEAHSGVSRRCMGSVSHRLGKEKDFDGQPSLPFWSITHATYPLEKFHSCKSIAHSQCTCDTGMERQRKRHVPILEILVLWFPSGAFKLLPKITNMMKGICHICKKSYSCYMKSKFPTSQTPC